MQTRRLVVGVDVSPGSEPAVAWARSEAVRSGVALEALAGDGDPVPALVDASRTADLLVLGSRGRSGFGDSELGSIAHRVAVHAHCPVVVVPQTAVRSEFADVGPVVVAQLGVPADRAARSIAAAHARATGEAVELVDAHDGVHGLDAVLAVRDATLIVVGCTHSDDRFPVRLGAVAAGLLARAECPVVLVGRPAELTGFRPAMWSGQRV
jgi:nucleotide-binding universal stress UspA family protein